MATNFEPNECVILLNPQKLVPTKIKPSTVPWDFDFYLYAKIAVLDIVPQGAFVFHKHILFNMCIHLSPTGSESGVLL